MKHSDVRLERRSPGDVTPLAQVAPVIVGNVILKKVGGRNLGRRVVIFHDGASPRDLFSAATSQYDCFMVNMFRTATYGEQGSWESGLSYECRALLFKALHNLIERCLLSRDFVRIGKWFVQPYDGAEKLVGESTHFSFAFAFFVHGESTVCASIDVRMHPLVRNLSRQHLVQAQASSSGAPAVKLNRTSALANYATEAVLLAPFGLSGALTGQVYKAVDLHTQRLLEDWRQFYPIGGGGEEGAALPPAVEVVVGGVKMRYPTCYVLATDMDDCASPVKSPPAPPLSPSLAVHLPEHVWQDSILNPTQHVAAEGDGTANQQPPVGHWDFVEPARKTSCSCSKCNPPGGVKNKGAVSSVKPGKGEKGSRGVVAPFHRRLPPDMEHSRCVGIGTPSGGPSSYPRGQSMTPNPLPTLHDSLPVPSVGSPASAAPSPLPNPHSQPASVPPADPTMPTLSPHPPAPPQPSTPLEAQDKVTPAATPSDLNGPKSVSSVSNQVFSPYPAASSVEAAPKPVDTMVGSQGPASTHSVAAPNPVAPPEPPVLKRPNLSSKEYEDEEELHSELLYDYSTLDAWLNHPVKRFKPSDLRPAEPVRPRPQRQSSTDHQPSPTNPNLVQTIKQEIKQEPCLMEMDDNVQPNKGSDPYDFDVENDMLAPTAKAIVEHYSRSPSTRKRLHTVMEEMVLPVLELIQFVDTRWSSEYNMLSRLHAVRKAVGAELANSENNIEILTEVEWKQAAGIVEVLGPLADATKEINKALKSRFSFYDSDPIFCPSMLCDPRFRGVLIDDMVAVNTLAIEVKKLSDKSSLEPNVKDEHPSCSSSSSGLWSSFDSIPNTTQPAIDNNSEVKDYLNEPREEDKRPTPGSGIPPFDPVITNGPINMNTSGNLFTNEGLQASYKDLDQIFDNSDDTSNDETLQVSTPPGSNKPGGPLEDPTTTVVVVKPPRNSGGNTSLNSCGGTNTLRPEELVKMFPTPPSMEHNPIASPCGHMSPHGPTTDLMIDSGSVRCKQEVYPNMGSPQEESIDDWSYVFRPPAICKMVGSSKYAPLTNLPSQTLPLVALPLNCVYKPSWVHPPVPPAAAKSPALPCPPRPGPPLSAPHPSHLPHPRAGLSPISPAAHFPPSPMTVAAMGGVGLPIHLQQQYRGGGGGGGVRTPCPPPPAYELPSPATSTASSYLNKNINSVEPVPTPVMARTPEANSLVVNILLGDTSLNIFRDHNFDSCTLCVCNAGPKVVGNIRGADAGIYLPAPPVQPPASLPFPPTSPYPGMSMNGPPPPYGMMGSSPGHHRGTQLDEDPIRCNCGFSAVVNRRLSHRSGLFYEDELEITGLAEDPSDRRKGSLSAYLLTNSKNSQENASELVDILPQNVIELLREQCVIVQSMSNSLCRASRQFRGSAGPGAVPYGTTVNMLEFSDGNEVTHVALDQGRQALLESTTVAMCKVEEMQQRQQMMQHTASGGKGAAGPCVHRWPYLRARGPLCNQDIVRVMKILQPLLQDAIQKKCTTRLWDAPYTVSGPLTWRQFHRLAGRGTDDRCEPQPIPSLVVGYDKDWLSLSPYAIQYWEKLLLEPYSYARDVAYIVVAPENDYVLHKVCCLGRHSPFTKVLLLLLLLRRFVVLADSPITKVVLMLLLLRRFVVLADSPITKVCRLGRHSPITKVLREGILRVGKSAATKLAKEPVDDWFNLLGDNPTTNMLKLYAQVCRHHLAPHLSQMPMDRTLLDPPEGSQAPRSSLDRSMPSPMPPPSTPEDKAPSTPKSDHETEGGGGGRDPAMNNQCVGGGGSDTNHDDEDAEPPAIVVYLVDPFTMGSDSTDLQRLACLGLLRCFTTVLAALPDNIRNNISVQIISLESIVELGKLRDRIRHSDHMRAQAFSVFSQCRRMLTHTSNIKALTGFGTAAMADLFLKSKDEKNRAPYRLYTPPYVLAPAKEKIESSESFGQCSTEHGSVLYVSYCLSEDQHWLLAVATDEKGEIFETSTINIDIPNRSRRKKASARRVGLQKLMDFVLGVISQSVQPWRLVVGRIGRIGHGELKGWSWLLSRKALVKASKHLKEICGQCGLMYPNDVPCVLSACLVSLEPDSALRLMPDQFTPDERFSQASVNCQLSTPQDVSCTHILVFPTSATTQSSQTAFQDQHINGPEFGDELFPSFEHDMPEGIEEMPMDLNEIFAWPETGLGGVQSPTGSPRRDSPSQPGSPSCGMGGTSDQHSPFPCNGTSRSGGSLGVDSQEEVGTLHQQPLALGYYVSTAPTGRMPRWFWASCPHLENVCPAFLKNSLHLHSPAIQQNSDDLLQQQSTVTVHPLDSQYTTDVLRYVLEGYNALSWLALDSNTRDRLSCLPVHIQALMQLYHMTSALV
uniref:Mediator of RNA polymerase II transcription subunit 13 n=1 Tax=Timema shepardi TaxID=629360 RepID=A0A7R9ART4_TIMSH|nr:unnamed protein product [Timema shepardi]